MSSILKVDQLQDSGGNAIITSNGSGTITPNFNNAGSLVLLNSQTASNDTILTFNSSLITSTYNIYELKYYNYQASTDANALHIALSTDNGSTYETSNMNRCVIALNSSNTNDSITTRYGAASSIVIQGTVWNNGNANTRTGAGSVIFYDLPSSKAKKIVFDTSHIDENGYTANTRGAVGFNSSSVINNFKIFQSGGNIAQGTFSLFGVKT